jgi:beta-barrel assembly-enhancing protease
MQTTWAGHYLNGRTAEREPVVVTITSTGLRIDPADEVAGGATVWWPYEELRQTQGFYPGEHVRLERGAEAPEVLVVVDQAFLDALRDVAPDATRGLTRSSGRWPWRRIALLAVAAVAVSGTLYLWVLPAAADAVARQVPPAWERELGDAITSQLLLGATICDDPTLTGAVDGIVARLVPAAPTRSYAFRVTVVDDSVINAFAAPGGHIVIYRGLIARTARPEEVAGVLAHEMQHVLLRHGTRSILREIPLRVFLGTIGGEMIGARDAAQAIQTMGMLRYGRRDEEEADREGLGLLVAARVDPQGMVAFFDTLATHARGVPRGLTYLSTHPATGERRAKLAALAAEARGPIDRLGPRSWAEVRSRCRAGG